MLSKQKRQKSNLKKVLPPLAGALSSSAMFHVYETTTIYIQYVVKA